MENLIYRGRRDSENVIGYIDSDGRVYRGTGADSEYVGRMEADGVLKCDITPVGKVDEEGFVYNCAFPSPGSPHTNPECVGKYENGLFYSSSCSAFGSTSSFLGMSDSSYAGTTDRITYDAAAAALLLLLDASSSDYSGVGTGSACGDRGSFLAILPVLALLSGIIIGSKAFIVSSFVALIIVLREFRREKLSFDFHLMKLKDYISAAGVGFFIYLAEGLIVILCTKGFMGMFIREQPETTLNAVISCVIFGIAGFLYSGLEKLKSGQEKDASAANC